MSCHASLDHIPILSDATALRWRKATLATIFARTRLGWAITVGEQPLSALAADGSAANATESERWDAACIAVEVLVARIEPDVWLSLDDTVWNPHQEGLHPHVLYRALVDLYLAEGEAYHH